MWSYHRCAWKKTENSWTDSRTEKILSVNVRVCMHSCTPQFPNSCTCYLAINQVLSYLLSYLSLFVHYHFRIQKLVLLGGCWTGAYQSRDHRCYLLFRRTDRNITCIPDVEPITRQQLFQNYSSIWNTFRKIFWLGVVHNYQRFHLSPANTHL